MAAVDHALAHAAGHDRRVEHLGDARDVLARALRAAADHDHRALRAAQQLGGALDRVLVDGAGVGLRRRRDQLDRRLARPGVHRAFQRHRTPPPRQQAAEGFVDQAGRRGGRVDAVGPLGEAAHDRELVGQFVQQPDIAADHGLLDLAGQRQHRRVHRIGRRQRRRGVEEAGARHHDVGRRLAASPWRSPAPCRRRPARGGHGSAGWRWCGRTGRRRTHRSARRAGRRSCRCRSLPASTRRLGRWSVWSWRLFLLLPSYGGGAGGGKPHRLSLKYEDS